MMVGLRAARLAGICMVLGSPTPVLAMGYDSLTCPELGERRVAYFVENGFCDPSKADQKDCRPIKEGSEADLPAATRTQVQMIIRTEARKSCPMK